MRFDVHTVRVHLVNQLMQTPQIKEVWHDGSDVVIMDFKTGESVAIHLVERYMSIDEIQYIFNHNADHGHYTMLILWSDMFMPSDGQVYEPDDWMFALLQLFGGKIYAYDAWREAPHIFTVHFHPLNTGRKFTIRHGGDVRINQIGINTIETRLDYFHGFWRVARFDGFAEAEQDDSYWDASQGAAADQTSVNFYFNLLGLTINANREDVKQAYRELARKHHPDLNMHTDTTLRMQKINDAYKRVMRFLDEEKSD